MSRLLLTIALAAGLPMTVAAQEAVAPDPFLWLEDVTGDSALTWVKARNAETEAALGGSAEFARLEARIRSILDSDARIPYVMRQGGYYYNFWRDARHARGIWRRTTPAEYRRAEPAWELLIDVDSLNRVERESWVWRGADCLRPTYRRCLVTLSRGGGDASVTREFDLETRQWVRDGFHRPEAKGGLKWINQDQVFVYTDFGEGSLTSSGYPRTVRRWTRGTPMAKATPVYEGQPDDMYISASRDLTRSFERDFVSRSIAFYNNELYLLKPDGALVRIDAPNSADKSVYREWLLLRLREPLTEGGTTWPAGSLVATRLDSVLNGKRQFEVLFTPSPTVSLEGYDWTRNHLVLTTLDNVKYRLTVLTPGRNGWRKAALSGLPAIGTVSVSPVDREENDDLWIVATDFLTPTTLSLGAVGAAPVRLKSEPVFFEAAGRVVEQHFATSEDGTRVPYFLVRRTDQPLDGTTPTLLYGYGGFEISLTPRYSGTTGAAWIERGGAYVVANIRGGGEYGPAWHQAALKQNRDRAYEDFAAVARDLVTRGVTSPTHLGTNGGSNGGLLVGNMLMQYPDLFGAVVVDVPLLDMRRYHKLLAGASWMAEYGDPDKPEEWEFIRTWSPYHLLQTGRRYPPALFTTSTRDDRVHPGHARKMAARMLADGQPVHYFENTEGGHAGSATNAQAAHMAALRWTFLWRELSRPVP